MIIAGLVAAALAGLLHCYIFYLESFAWTTRALAVFGMERESAEATKEMAFNQGFYNLLLAVEAIAGVAVHQVGHPVIGLALTSFGVGSMLAAALLLFATSPDKRSAAAKQGVLPLIAVVILALGALA